MKVTSKPIRFERLPKDYVGLCKLLMPRPIHDKVDLENVTEMAEALAGHALTEDQTDYFDLLSSLIETFDREHVPPSKVSGLDALPQSALVARLKQCVYSSGKLCFKSQNTSSSLRQAES